MLQFLQLVLKNALTTTGLFPGNPTIVVVAILSILQTWEISDISLWFPWFHALVPVCPSWFLS